MKRRMRTSNFVLKKQPEGTGGGLQAGARLQVERFLETVAEAPRRLLMLDFDGTLAPVRKERNRVSSYPEIAALVQQIMNVARTRVVIVSGRDVSELPSRLGIQPVPELWGLHGLQRRKPDGTVETAPLDQSHLDGLADAGRWLQYQRLQHIAEFKTGSIAAHWRGLSESEAAEISARVTLGWDPIAARNGLQMLEFDNGVEIRAPGANKGDVVRILIAEEGPETAAAYLGDDSSDEFAFRAIQGRGLGVLVRPHWRQTAAQLWLKPPTEVSDFLNKWLAASRSSAAGGAAASATNG